MHLRVHDTSKHLLSLDRKGGGEIVSMSPWSDGCNTVKGAMR